MTDFDYAAPQSVDEALKLLGSGSNGVAFLAGGTDILVQLREGHREAELVVDLKKIPELTELSFSPSNGLTLGAATPCYQIYGNPEITAAYPALADATRIIGGWQIQSRASVGGNLCNSSPAADSIPALIASDARCNIAGPSGRRSVSVAEFCTAPGRNVLQANEFLVNLQFPAPQSGAGSHYLRFIPRNEMDIAVVGAGAWVKLNDTGDTIESARLALAAVAPTPIAATKAADSLAGKPATEESIAAAGELAKEIASPISDMRGPAEYRAHLVGVLSRRAFVQAIERAKQSLN